MARSYSRTRPTPATPPASDPTQLALVKALPVSVTDLAVLQAEAEATERDDLPMIVVDSPESYAAADAALTAVLARIDGRTEQRTSVTGPLYGVIKTVEGWFRPELSTLTRIRDAIKLRMGAYLQLCAEAEAEARLEAQAAVEAGDAGALVASLNTAEDAAGVRDAGAARVTFRWQVKGISEDLLPAEYWTPDLAAIEKVAKDAGSAEEGSDAAPVIPGVHFERVANVAGSHGRR